VTRLLEATGIKKSNRPCGSIIPTNFVITSKDLTTTPDESSQIQEAYHLDYVSLSGSEISQITRVLVYNAKSKSQPFDFFQNLK
jgi:hypothetical protein